MNEDRSIEGIVKCGLHGEETPFFKADVLMLDDGRVAISLSNEGKQGFPVIVILSVQNARRLLTDLSREVETGPIPAIEF
jgi:hypothetical protein